MYNSTQPIFELKGVSLLTTRKTHVRRLNDILHLSLERNDLPRARRAWSILSQCKEFDWKEHWRTGIHLVPLEKSDNPSRQKVDLLKKLMRFYPEEQEAILLELIILLANDGHFREAADELDLYLPSLPYHDNTVMHTYAGLLSFKLAENSTGLGMRIALEHFRNALHLDKENEVARKYIEKIAHMTVQNPNSNEEAEADENDDDASTLHIPASIDRAKRLRQSD